MKYLSLLLLGLFLSACSRPPRDDGEPLFTRLAPEATHVTFNNRIEEREGFNVLIYEYFYNGGGVAAGDVNNDGLPDLYFTANMGPNALYLNKGAFAFEDVTDRAGVGGDVAWTTGVTMADVNGDGWLDLYVCRSGSVSEVRRRNQLFINNGDLTFTEQAAAYGLDDPSYSTHATFFDYDRDGDLDVFLVNHPVRRYAHFDAAYMKSQRDSLAGDKLYRNEDGFFVDVSEAAGIIGNPIGFGLSAQAGDVNRDGWPDLYVANDYIEDDYLYINQGDGTFQEAADTYLTRTSYSSMGTDIADVNNDALPDIVTLDMLAEDNRRQKLLKGQENFTYYRQMRAEGYHEQYQRNMLHVNQGAGPFLELGQLAGISNTDWSWAPLVADFDNDGYKDLFVTNGYLRDYTDLDFLKGTVDKAFQEANARGEALSSYQLVQQMASTPLGNYAFRNEGDLTFSNRTRAWGLAEPSFSGGAAYADLDGDGDLDLIVNNTNREAFLYRNEARTTFPGEFLAVKLLGKGKNRFGVGAQVELTAPDGQVFFQELYPSRGYQSAVEPVLHFGLGAHDHVDLVVTWPDQTRQVRKGVAAGQTITLRQQDAVLEAIVPPPPEEAFLTYDPRIAFVHREDPFVDFEREPLLPHMLSRLGPALATADVNRDGLEDVFVGGARHQSGGLFLQQADGGFREAPVEAFRADSAYEDVDAVFLDVDQDGDEDLYVVSGGNDAPPASPLYQDRVYLNNGFGKFEAREGLLPAVLGSGGAVAADDFDGDGDVDVFVGGRVVPGQYPYAPRSYLLENAGGRFIDVTEQASEALLNPGMVTGALWQDLDGEGGAELIIAGEWMPIRVFRRDASGSFSEITEQSGLAGTNGWWNALLAGDLDGDGDVDLVAGNHGRNGQLKPSRTEPVAIVAADFDGDGSVDPVMGAFIQGRRYPVPGRDELLARLPMLAQAFPTYASYADATLDDVLGALQPGGALTLEAYTFASTIFENQGDGTFQTIPLPIEAQVAPVFGLLGEDVDRDGRLDLLIAGNDAGERAQFGQQNAGLGLLLLGKGAMSFAPVRVQRSGFAAPGDVRRLSAVQTRTGPLVVVANNDAAVTAFALGTVESERAARQPLPVSGALPVR